MSEIDPVQFGEMCGFVKATHSDVKEMKEDFKNYCKENDDKVENCEDRLAGLENRNKNIKENWKKVKWASVSLGAIWGGLKAVGSFFT